MNVNLIKISVKNRLEFKSKLVVKIRLHLVVN